VQLRRDLLPALEKAGVKLFAIGIGSAEAARTFAEQTEFPVDMLLVDDSEQADVYGAIGTRNTQLDEQGKMVFEGVQSMWSQYTNDAIRKRGREDLNAIVGSLFKPGIYKPLPPQGPQAMERSFVQGATIVFDGSKVLLEHYDKSSGDHADLEDIKNSALS
jgi:hypothetical protein